MSVVVVQHQLTTADRVPVAGRTVTAELVSPSPVLADHSGSIVLAARAVSSATGAVELRLTPQVEVAAAGTHYRVRVTGTELVFYCVVPASGPVQLANILVDPATLEPLPPDAASMYLLRAERGAPNGVAPLVDGQVPTEYLPAGGGGGDVPDASTTVKGILRLAGDLGGTATTPTVPGLAAKYVKPGPGIPSSDLTAAVQTSLGKADTAVQPGALAAVATTGAYADLTGKPTIPDSPDDIGAAAVAHTHTIANTTGLQTALDGTQPLDADLTAIAALTPNSDDIVQRKAGAWTNRTPAQLKTDLALTRTDVGLANVDNTADLSKPISTATQTALDTKQASDSDLTAIAGLAPSNGDLLQRIAGAWAAQTPAQVKTSLALVKGDVGLGSVDNTADVDKPVSTAQQTAINGRVPLSVIDAAGDLFLGTGDNTVTRLAKGDDDQLLGVVAGAVTWVDPSAGGGGGGIQAFASSGRQTVAIGPCNTSGTWTLCPTEYRVTIPAVAGDVLHWAPRLIAGISGGDAEIDVASVISGAPVRYYSSGTTTQAPNGHGGLYLGGNYANGLNAVMWVVTADDLDAGNVTLALMYRAGGSGAQIGSTVYPGQIDVTNHGQAA